MLKENQNSYFDITKRALSHWHSPYTGSDGFSDFNSKIYKLLNCNDTNMIPGDLIGSPDELFFFVHDVMNRGYFLGGFFLWRVQ